VFEVVAVNALHKLLNYLFTKLARFFLQRFENVHPFLNFS